MSVCGLLSRAFFSIGVFLPIAICPSAFAGADLEAAIGTIRQIQRADYEGDRPVLARLHDELQIFAAKTEVASRVHYWRGFAYWRRAFNGFNENVDRRELEDDLTKAVAAFETALAIDPAFVDAKIGAVSCIDNLIFLNLGKPDRVRELAAKGNPLFREAREADPDNPRLLWITGAQLWYRAPGGREKREAEAIATYEKGLEAARRLNGGAVSPWEPSWGEPELLMNLAWAHFNKAKSDPEAAARYAHAALELVPYWHYVRDILLPQIERARANGR